MKNYFSSNCTTYDLTNAFVKCDILRQQFQVSLREILFQFHSYRPRRLMILHLTSGMFAVARHRTDSRVGSRCNRLNTVGGNKRYACDNEPQSPKSGGMSFWRSTQLHSISFCPKIGRHIASVTVQQMAQQSIHQLVIKTESTMGRYYMSNRRFHCRNRIRKMEAMQSNDRVSLSSPWKTYFEDSTRSSRAYCNTATT